MVSDLMIGEIVKDDQHRIGYVELISGTNVMIVYDRDWSIVQMDQVQRYPEVQSFKSFEPIPLYIATTNYILHIR